MSGQTLFDKYGGFSSISKVIMSFYDTLLDSDELGPFFDEVDMKRLIDHQIKFVASLLGGPADYTGERLQQLHAHLSIQDQHFDEMKRVLNTTLEQHGFTEDDRETVLVAFEERRRLIVA